jgi:hypothetical protein
MRTESIRPRLRGPGRLLTGACAGPRAGRTQQFLGRILA